MTETCLTAVEKASQELRKLYASYGYLPYKMSKFEEYDLYAQNRSFLVSDNIITFTDTDGKLLALKPDVTLSIVKNTKEEDGMRKVYYTENVYRPAAGSRAYREIPQTGLECIGDVDDYCLSEVLSLALQSLEQLSGNCVLDVSSLSLLSEMFGRLGLTPAEQKEVLRCIGEKNAHDLGGVTRLDETGAEKIRQIIGMEGSPDRVIPSLTALYPDTAWQAQVAAFASILSTLPQDKIQVDFSVVSDTRYYNGIAFKGFIEGLPDRVLSGGQYDLLMQRLHKNARAVGFAVYLDQYETYAGETPEYDVDTVLLYDAGAPLPLIQKAVCELRQAGQSVQALKELPAKLRYRNIVRLDGNGGLEKC